MTVAQNPVPSGSSLLYGSGMADLDFRISRVKSENNSELKYLGLNTIVSRSSVSGFNFWHYGSLYPTTGEAGDKYVGLDRFGRAVGWLWSGVSGSADFHRYGFDRNSNRMYKTDELYHTWDELYHADGPANGYDGLNQLTQYQRGVATDTNADGHVDWVMSGSEQTWNIDAAGNFDDIGFGGPSQDREHNRQNQITELDGQDLYYDGNGNLIEDTTFGLTYTYDAWNRLTAIIHPGQTGPDYEYDALGRRIVEGRVEPTPYADNHLYYNDAWQVIHDRHPGPLPEPGAPPAYWDEFNVYFWSAVSTDTMLSRGRDKNRDYVYEERIYPMQDAQGNVSALGVEGGTMIERVTQTPYGVPTVRDPVYYLPVPVNTHDWRYFHQGLRLDFSREFYDNRARMYSPHWMRFIQNDPIGFAAGDPNLYRYVGNGPVSRTDPSGLQVIKGGTVGPPTVSIWQSDADALLRDHIARAEAIKFKYLQLRTAVLKEQENWWWQETKFRGATAFQWLGGELQMFAGAATWSMGGAFLAGTGFDDVVAATRSWNEGRPINTLRSGLAITVTGSPMVGTFTDIATSMGAGAWASRATHSSGLVHMSPAADDIISSGKLGLPSNNYAGPASNANLSGWPLTLRTGLWPGEAYGAVPIPAAGNTAFSRVFPVGLMTTWQRLTGQQYTARGILDLSSGAFYRTGVNWNQALTYGLDLAFTGAAIGSGLYLWYQSQK